MKLENLNNKELTLIFGSIWYGAGFGMLLGYKGWQVPLFLILLGVIMQLIAVKKITVNKGGIKNGINKL